MAELVVGSALSLGGGSAGAGWGGLAAATPAGLLILAGVGGALLGTAINDIPGVSDTIQKGMEQALDLYYLSGSTRDSKRVVNGLIAAAATELGKITAAGGPEKDPAGNHHQKEIKTMLERALKVARRLPGKLQAEAVKKINAIAEQAGVTLG